MKNLGLIALSAILVGCGHTSRLEIGPIYENYVESYTKEINPRIHKVGTVTAIDPDEDEMSIKGIGGYVGLGGTTPDRVALRVGFSYVAYDPVKYNITTVADGPTDVEVDIYSGAIEFGYGYELIDSKSVKLRPELILKEELYFYNNKTPFIKTTDFVAHEYLGLGLHIELSALAIRASYMVPPFNDNNEIDKAHAINVAALLVIGQ